MCACVRVSATHCVVVRADRRDAHRSELHWHQLFGQTCAVCNRAVLGKVIRALVRAAALRARLSLSLSLSLLLVVHGSFAGQVVSLDLLPLLDVQASGRRRRALARARANKTRLVTATRADRRKISSF